jgi:hypothetical protein
VSPGIIELRSRRRAGDFRVFVPVFGAHRITEIVGMELRHHIHRRSRHALGNPIQYRIRAALDVIWHN